MSLGNGLILDIITAIILAASAFIGVKKGFVWTLISFASWFMCIVLGFLSLGVVSDYLCENTSLDDIINNTIISSVSESITESSAYQAIPDLYSSLVDNTTSDIIYATSSSLTSIIISITSFILVVLIVRLICFIMLHLFSKKHNDGVIGFFDGLLGFVFGLTRGIILVFVLFAVLVPLLGVVFPGLSTSVLNSMDTSYVAKYLYNDNALLIIIRDFFL